MEDEVDFILELVNSQLLQTPPSFYLCMLRSGPSQSIAAISQSLLDDLFLL